MRSIERSPAFIYVVHFSGPAAPWDELRMLQEELEKYKSKDAAVVMPSLTRRISGLLKAIRKTRRYGSKLARLEKFVRDEIDHDDGVLDVVPTSGKYCKEFAQRGAQVTDIR